jgi:hypothetical protein
MNNKYTYNIANGDIIWKTNFFTDADEFAATETKKHFYEHSSFFFLYHILR